MRATPILDRHHALWNPSVWAVVGLVFLVGTMLSGCAGDLDKLRTTSTTPVCTALIGPIKYNTQKRTSLRFAGPKLAPDLKQRNQVGQNLGCKQYTQRSQ